MHKNNLLIFYIILFSTILIQSQCSDSPMEPTKDTTPPTVLSISPLSNATNVSINDSVIIIFSEKLSAQTVNNTTIYSANLLVNVTLTDSIAILTFATPLNYSTTYNITLLSAISDLAGNRITTNFIFSFITEIDPATIPPIVVTTYPTNGTINVDITDSITVTFSKDIDITTINDTTFINNDGRVGTVTYDSLTKTATFIPTTQFSYDSTYTFSITTIIKDTNGNNLEKLFTWSFSTPTIIPQVTIVTPFFDSLIIGDTITFTTFASNPIGIEIIQYHIDNILVAILGTSGSSQYLLDASSFEIGSEHTMHAVVFDSLGNIGYSDTLTFFYLWQLVLTDGNDGFSPLIVPNDLRKMFARSTDSTLELRYEYAVPWDSAYWDTVIDLAIFFDTDFSSSTGRRTNGGDTINDIGAEYRALIGVFRSDTVVHIWDPNCTDTVCWKGYQTFADVYSLEALNFSNALEFGVKWSEIGDPNGVDIVSINVLFQNSLGDPLAIIKDYMPDKITNSHVRVFKENRYIGPPSLINRKSSNYNKYATSSFSTYNNPFD